MPSGDTSLDFNPQAVQPAIEDVRKSLEEGTVPHKIFNNELIHEAEMDRIFGQAWLYVGHETEIPDVGDYARRYLGQDPYIFVRDEDGEIHVLFNSCRHRGTEVCRGEQGNAAHFRCPYHGWTYDNSGELVGITFESQGYDDLDKSEWSLIPAPRVDEYEGFYFASLAEDGPSLSEFLGDMTWYLDMQTKLFEEGLEVVGDPHRYEVDADWKNGAENFAGDVYHTQMTHRSVFNAGLLGEGALNNPRERYQFSRITACENGHGIIMIILPQGQKPAFAYPKDILDYDRLNQEQTEIVKRSVTHVGTIFPNTSFIHIATPTHEERRPRGCLSIRKWRPLGPGRMETWNWLLVPKNAPQKYKDEAYKSVMSSFSPSGNFEQDDFNVWPHIATTAGSKTVDRRNNKLNYMAESSVEDDVSDGLNHSTWPGRTDRFVVTDIAIKNVYDMWYQMMADGAEMSKEQ